MAKLSTSGTKQYYRLYYITFNKQKESYLKDRVINTFGIIIYPRDFHFDSGEFIDIRIPASKLLQVMYGSY